MQTTIWAFFLVTYIFNPYAPDHYERHLKTQFFKTQQECLNYRDFAVEWARTHPTGDYKETGCMPLHKNAQGKFN